MARSRAGRAATRYRLLSGLVVLAESLSAYDPERHPGHATPVRVRVAVGRPMAARLLT
jgi:hypothetical protein